MPNQAPRQLHRYPAASSAQGFGATLLAHCVRFRHDLDHVDIDDAAAIKKYVKALRADPAFPTVANLVRVEIIPSLKFFLSMLPELGAPLTTATEPSRARPLYAEVAAAAPADRMGIDHANHFPQLMENTVEPPPRPVRVFPTLRLEQPIQEHPQRSN